MPSRCSARQIAAETAAKGFADLAEARSWAGGFARWYHHDHRHSGIRYVSPAQRHAGEDHAILAARHELYTRARALNPARWSGPTRNWSPIGAVTLNPERDCIVRRVGAAKIYSRWLHERGDNYLDARRASSSPTWATCSWQDGWRWRARPANCSIIRRWGGDPNEQNSHGLPLRSEWMRVRTSHRGTQVPSAAAALARDGEVPSIR